MRDQLINQDLATDSKAELRTELIGELNRALETDYGLIEHMLLKSKMTMILPDQSGRFSGNVTALSMLCDMLDIEQIYPLYENDIIQRFD